MYSKEKFRKIRFEIENSPFDFRISFSSEKNVPNKNYTSKEIYTQELKKELGYFKRCLF